MALRRICTAVIGVILTLAIHRPFTCIVTASMAPEEELLPYRKRVEDMFYHAYDNYLNHAFPYDELRPLTCDGINTWGNFQVLLR